MVESYYCWQPDYAAPSVLISWNVMEEIKTHVILGYKSLSRRGAEIGGALLGSFDAESNRLVIDGFEPIQIEYSFGPSYIFSDADRERWGDWVRALRDASPHIVGICRSQTRPGLQVAADDDALIRHFLPGGDGVLLLVKPLSDRECVAAFFPFRQGVVVNRQTPSSEFPFGVAQRPPQPEAIPLPPPKAAPLSRWIIVSAIAAGACAAAVLHRISEAPVENPVPSASYPINSSSERPGAKPAPAGPASAETGDQEAVGDTSSSAPARFLDGITSKASHLWPFHSDKPAPPTQ